LRFGVVYPRNWGNFFGPGKLFSSFFFFSLFYLLFFRERNKKRRKENRRVERRGQGMLLAW
jgi:hypothetical protein